MTKHKTILDFGFWILDLKRGFTPPLKFSKILSLLFSSIENLFFENLLSSLWFVAAKPQRISRAGFTLFEMVISIGLFSILIVSASSITIAVSNAQIKAQNIQANLDNIRFSLELITKEMRTGTNWSLSSICSPLGSEISFTTSLNEKRVYFLNSTTGIIMRAKVPISGADCSDLSKVKPFTAEEVLVNRLNFSFMYGALAGPADGQPRATITLKVTSRSPKEQLKSSMDLQTTIVQRFRDL